MFKEIVKSRFNNYVLESVIEKASSLEIKDARNNYKSTGECEHLYIKDMAGWLYDVRECIICGAGLGTI